MNEGEGDVILGWYTGFAWPLVKLLREKTRENNMKLEWYWFFLFFFCKGWGMVWGECVASCSLFVYVCCVFFLTNLFFCLKKENKPLFRPTFYSNLHTIICSFLRRGNGG